MIRHEGRKYVLYTADGSRVLGTHSIRAKAEKQELAIRLSKLRAQGRIAPYAKENPISLGGIVNTILALGTLATGGYWLYSKLKFGGNAKWLPTQFNLAQKSPGAAAGPQAFALLEDVASGAGVIVQVTGAGTLDNLPSSTGVVTQVVAVTSAIAGTAASAIGDGDECAFHNQDVIRWAPTSAVLVTEVTQGVQKLLTTGAPAATMNASGMKLTPAGSAT